MFPPGVETRPIVWNLPTALTGGLVDTIDVEVTPILGAADALVWTATGEQLTSLSDTFTGTEGVAFDIPVVDQDGWRDPAGNNFTNWAYKAVATITKGRQAITYEKNFQIKLADLDLDLALVPDGPAGDPTFTPVPPGKSAYEIAVDHGYVGTETDWLTSLHSTVPGPASTIPGPPNTLTAGTITQIPAGGQPTVSITGTAPNQTLNLGLVDGANGIGVPTTGNNPGDLLRWNGTVWIQTTTKFHEGTGNPNGVVTAPVGSTFVNTESGGYNGARRWTKATGSGNTGWVVVDGDTGRRNIPAEWLQTGWIQYFGGPISIQRTAAGVNIAGAISRDSTASASTSKILFTLPLGWRPANFEVVGILGTTSSLVTNNLLYIGGSGAIEVHSNTNTTAGASYRLKTEFFPSNQDWPSTLP